MHISVLLAALRSVAVWLVRRLFWLLVTAALYLWPIILVLLRASGPILAASAGLIISGVIWTVMAKPMFTWTREILQALPQWFGVQAETDCWSAALAIFADLLATDIVMPLILAVITFEIVYGIFVRWVLPLFGSVFGASADTSALLLRVSMVLRMPPRS